jgi:anti-sigma factor RsiW
MRCAQGDADFQAFLDGELSSSKALAFQQHVDGCPSCQSRLQFFRDIRAELRAQTATSKASPSFKEQLRRRLYQLERRRRLSKHVAVPIAAIALLLAMTGIYWLYTDQTTSPLLSALVRAHAGTVRSEIALAFPSADIDMVQRWLDQRLPFRPVIPQASWGGFHLLGARILSLSDHKGAFLLFGSGDRRVSLVSLPHPSRLPGPSKKVEMDGITFWVFIQGVYTLVLWSEHGLLNAMVSDEEVDESLEYARLCAQQMRAPT